jgi:hypothetical protein
MLSKIFGHKRGEVYGGMDDTGVRYVVEWMILLNMEHVYFLIKLINRVTYLATQDMDVYLGKDRTHVTTDMTT